jgi:hypothetical protein
MMPVKDIPDNDHVLRHFSWTKLRKDEDDNVLGVLAAGLRRRPGESSLSATWIEFFSGNSAEKCHNAVHATRNTQDCRPRSHFAIANVGTIKRVCGSNASMPAKVRIVHEPEDGNPGHAAIRQLPDADFDLLEALADEAFTTLIPNASIPK